MELNTRLSGHGYFKRPPKETKYEIILTCLRKGNLKKETEFLLIAGQNNSLRTKIKDGEYTEEYQMYIIWW